MVRDSTVFHLARSTQAKNFLQGKGHAQRKKQTVLALPNDGWQLGLLSIEARNIRV